VAVLRRLISIGTPHLGVPESRVTVAVTVPGERLTDAASRALRDKAGLTGVTFSQLHVFDRPDRDERGWVLSVGHSAALSGERIPPARRLARVADWRPIEPLLFDHADIVTLAVEELRRRYGRLLDPDDLLGQNFTVLEMRRLYQAIFGRPLVKDTFRRYIIGAVEPTGELATAFGRPPELFGQRQDVPLPAGTAAVLITGKR
jgi:ADP-ribose pyrophosphatase YjhB (NUDIX family)